MRDLDRRLDRLETFMQSHEAAREGAGEQSHELWAMQMEWTALSLVRGVDPGLNLNEEGVFFTLDGRFALSTRRMDLEALMGPKTVKLQENIPLERWREFLVADEEAAELHERLQFRADGFTVPEDYKPMKWAWTQEEVDSFSGMLKPHALFIDADERESTRRLSYVLLHDGESRAVLSALTRRREVFVGGRGKLWARVPASKPMEGGVRRKLLQVASGALTIIRTTKSSASAGPVEAGSVGAVAVRLPNSQT